MPRQSFDSAAGIDDDALILEVDFEQVEEKKPTKKPMSSHQKRGVCALGDSITRMEKDYRRWTSSKLKKRSRRSS